MKIEDRAPRCRACRVIAIVVILIIVLLLLSSACGGRGKVMLEREPAVLLNELNYDLANWLGKKVWVLGIYVDERITGDGIAFLVLDFNSVLTDEVLEEHTFARLVGDNLPPYDVTGAEIIVYGQVQDYGEVYNDPYSSSVPLVYVEKYHVIGKPQEEVAGRDNLSATTIAARWSTSMVEGTPTQDGAPEGTEAREGDRSLIISGGVDSINNSPHYRDNIKAKYKRMRELGLSADQIDVLYADGADVDITEKANDVDTEVNIVDAGASKQNVMDTIRDCASSMSPSHTLAIFVTDHGTGYDPTKAWDGARPAFSGVDATSGKLYAETSIKIDLTMKVFRKSIHWVSAGKLFKMHMAEDGTFFVYMKHDYSKWKPIASDEQGWDGQVSETEIDMDLDGDGEIEEHDGWDYEDLTGLLTEDVVHYDNLWDLDGDGEEDYDVIARWDGEKYVVERLEPDGTWTKIAEDKNHDNVIDERDGGVDFNPDGDQVGFHEGINLWGREVLWDYELATMLKELKEKGIHIFAEMTTCYSGGFIGNLEGIVDGIYTGSSEDTLHWSYRGKEGFEDVDQMAFVQNLNGFGWDDWRHAAEKAKEADAAAASARGEEKNSIMTSFPTFFESKSAFELDVSGVYTVMIDLPNDLRTVYGFEIILGLQQPSWLWAGFPEGLPAGMQEEMVPGGIRAWSIEPLPVSPFLVHIKGELGSEVLYIRLTDEDHDQVGYLTVEEGEIPVGYIGGWAPGWGFCFACDTLVLMADNSLKRISDVQVGEMVHSYDVDTRQTLIADVTATNNGEADHYYLINGNLKVTPPHPFFTTEGQWVAVEDLKAGDKIRSFQGLVEITSIEKVNSGQRICNISVRDFHNFFVSANGKDFYLVHEGS